MSDWDWGLDGWIVLAGIMSAVSCALPGNYLVLRKQSLMGDAISHAVLPGLAIAFMLTASRAPLPMFIGAVVVGVLTALLTQVITEHGKVENGAAMGVVFSILFALGLVLIRQVDTIDLDPGCVLYGSLEAIGIEAVTLKTIPPQAVNLALALGLNVVFILVCYKELKLAAFDPELATTLGINANVIHYLLMIVVAITTVANFEAVGSILVIAMLIAPSATAHLLTDRLWLMIVLSAIIAGGSAIVGHVLAIMVPRWVGLGVGVALNTSAMMAMVAGGCYALALLFSPTHGLAAHWLHRRSVAVQIVAEDILGLLYRWEEIRPQGKIAMPRGDLLDAVGSGMLTRRALRKLINDAFVARDAVDNRSSNYRLEPEGEVRARNLVRSHRLWEAYIYKHFDLPTDHLHAPAERLEHFVTPDMQEELTAHVDDQTTDPHGRKIPADDSNRA